MTLLLIINQFNVTLWDEAELIGNTLISDVDIGECEIVDKVNFTQMKSSTMKKNKHPPFVIRNRIMNNVYNVSYQFVDKMLYKFETVIIRSDTLSE